MAAKTYREQFEKDASYYSTLHVADLLQIRERLRVGVVSPNMVRNRKEVERRYKAVLVALERSAV